MQYYEGEMIDITFALSHVAEDLEYGFAWVGLFADNVSDYSLASPAYQTWVYYWSDQSTGTIQLLSRNLLLESKYKAVMAISYSDPLRVLGVSNTFEVFTKFSKFNNGRDAVLRRRND